MILWLDAQLPPALAPWIAATFGITTQAVRDLGLTTAKDPEIFQAARDAKAVVMTKDADFAELVERLGPPPQILWVTCGNTTNARLKQIFGKSMPMAISRLQAGDALIEITDLP
jgi:predicted nuclease of predicted toxin-antitoxin system